MEFIQGPIISKIVAAVASAAIIGTGGVALVTRESTQRHDLQIEQLLEMQKDVKTIVIDLNEVKTAVTVLKDRDERTVRP